MSKEMREQINKVKSFSKFLNESEKFPLTNDGRMGLNLEFKYNNRVYYINTNERTVKTEHYDGIEIKLPKRIVLPNINTIEDKFSGDFNRRISNLEQSLEVDNVRYKDLQDYLKSINWEMEKDKQNLKFQLEDFINNYGEDILHNVINQLNVQFNKR